MIPNVSLPPLLTCVENPPCAELCYARKFHTGFARHTAGVKWDHNLEAYRSDPVQYFNSIIEQLRNNLNIRLFRWHVGGDIPDQIYLEGMYHVSREIRHIDFLAYTRRDWAVPASGINFNVIRSLWLEEKDDEEERKSLPYPWFKVVPKGEPATCTGNCDRCARCWHLKPGEGITVNLH